MATTAFPPRAARPIVPARASAGGAAPAWPRGRWCVPLRAALQVGLLFPLLRGACAVEVRNRERLAGLAGPVIIASNHASHLDAPVVLAALPPDLRRRVAVAAAADYFFARPPLGALVGLLLNAFPFQRTGVAVGALAACRRLAGDGWSLLLFPEGTRSTTGAIAPFRPGIGRLAVDLNLPVVPVRVDGLHAVLPKGARWPRRGRVTVAFGPPLRVEPGADPAEAARRVEAVVRALGREEA
jgi:1-acyl-sn-glycerol-3-phosphate acyltransferase